MREYNNYPKEGLREGLTCFARKDFSESQKGKLAKAICRWHSVNIQISLLISLLIANVLMVLIHKMSFPAKAALYFGLNADIAF